MDTHARTTRISVTLKSLLSRGDWIYVLALLVPIFVYSIALKVVRIFTQVAVPGPLGFLDQVRSDILFNLGYAALWVGLFAIFRTRPPRMALLALFHLVSLGLILLVTAAHFFYQTTGSALDYNLLAVSFSTFGEIQAAVGSEMTTLHWLLISLVLFYGLAGPALVTLITTGDWHLPTDLENGTGGSRESQDRASSSWTPAVLCAAAGFVVLSALPSLTGASNSFSRAALVNIFVVELTAPDFEKINARVEANMATETPPTDTRLAETPQTDKRNVVMVFLESTRAESTTPYNEKMDTTPFLDDLSKESLMAENAYAVVPHTSKALVATLCGVPPPLDSKNSEADPGAIPSRCIADLLEEQGYNSVFFQSATEEFERRRMLVDSFGYEDFHPVEGMDPTGYDKVNYFGWEDDIMLEPSRNWLEDNAKDQPFLATYLTVTPHHDYVVPQSYDSEKLSDNEDESNYLNTVSYQDQFLEKLFQQYKDLGLYEDTVFVVLGDHGEGFGEHGLYQHDNTIYNEGLRIPLLVHDPKNPKPSRVEEPVNEMDVLPTLADTLGYDVAGGEYPGTSMRAPIKDRTLSAGCYRESSCLASIDGDQKYIYHFGNRPEEVFDLSKDPQEKTNLAEERDKDALEDRRYDLLAWQARVMASYERQALEQTGPE